MTTGGVVVIAGIYLAAKIVSYIAGEMTEDERQKQETIKKNFDSYNKEIVRFKEAHMQNAEQQNASELTRIYYNRNQYLIQQLDERVAERKQFLEEIKETRTRVSAALDTKKGETVLTPLRRNSLNLLFRQLTEVSEKCFAYINYLNKYKKELSRLSSQQLEFEPFSIQLPQAYPYRGYILWLDLVDYQHMDNSTYTMTVDNLFQLTIKIDDKAAFPDIEYDKIPVMISRFGINDDWMYHASVERGLFQVEELRNTHLGTSAVVTEYWVEDGWTRGVILKYRNSLKMFMPSANLISTSHYPLVHQELTVYPVQWYYGLGKDGATEERYYPITVSERRSDASSSLSFSCFPVCFTHDDFEQFVEQLTSKGLEKSNDEWLLGPTDEQDCSLRIGVRLKAQLGSQPLFYLKLQERDSSGVCLTYDGMCNENEKTFSADDIFVPFDVSITPYIIETSNETIAEAIGVEDISDVDCFIWDIYEEFRVQHKIKEEREGLSYFLKWESITNQLVEYLMQGDSIKLQVTWNAFERKDRIFASIQNSKALDKFLKNFADKVHGRTLGDLQQNFFVKGNDDLRYDAKILNQCSTLCITGRNVATQFQQDDKVVELYIQTKPYAECCQRMALQRFRSGQLVNSSIQAVCLNGASAKATRRDDVALRPFHNNRIAKNDAQRKAVEQAFLEKNCYFIQGPPGTGKTTVIRELVAQVFDANPDSNVLIVSQANVAVDNALSGLLNGYQDVMVRIGDASRISTDLQSATLSARCQEYLSKLAERKELFDPNYYEEWRSLITPRGTSTSSPALSELMLRKYRLVGATCVGIARRNIGLERTEFDLVIIDEAGKALPAELLIPLLRAKKMVMIGDHKQLPPVINPVLYDEEKIELEERDISVNQLFAHSFFERLYNGAPNECKTMLNRQFRMPKVIGEAISTLFYNGELESGEGTENKTPIFSNNNLVLYNFDNDPSYREEYEEKKAGKKLINRREAEAVYALITEIRKKNKECRIAVITPYRGQKRRIGNYLIQRGLHYQLEGIAVDTIDAFQGSEAEVVIFCTTRANRATQFFMDSRRINVALSRAMNELIILGKLSYFYKDYFKRKGSCLPALADYLKKYGVVNNVTPGQLSSQQGQSESKRFILSINDIIVPPHFLENEAAGTIIEAKKSEYYQYGDFREPILVLKSSDGFELSEGYEQYCAMLELGIQECVVMVR